MTLPGSSATSSDASVIATHTVSGKEYPVGMTADDDGHIHGSAEAWSVYLGPRATTTTAIDYVEIFNASGSGKLIRLRGIYAIIINTAASALTTSYTFDVFRTSAVGTGGTAAAASATKPAAGAATIYPWDTSNTALPAQITARALATGGATASQFLFDMSLYAEETQPTTMIGASFNWLPEMPRAQAYMIREGQGVKIRQLTATASTGVAFGFLITFSVT